MNTIEIKKVLLKRGNTEQNEAYTGLLGEVTLDTELNCLRIHDGVTPGGEIVASTATTIQDIVDEAISGLLNGAPEALDTLKELADAFGENSDSITDILTTLATKANSADLATVATSGSYDDLTDKPAAFDPIGLATEAYVDEAISGFNAYDQSLNTTDSPTFANLYLSGSTLTFPDGSTQETAASLDQLEVDGRTILTEADQDIEIQTSYRRTITATAGAGSTMTMIVVDTSENDDIVEVAGAGGWEVDLNSGGDTPYWKEFTAASSIVGGNSFAIVFTGLSGEDYDYPIIEGTTYTFRKIQEDTQQWTFRDTGTLVAPGGAILSSETEDIGEGASYRDFAIELPSPDGIYEYRWEFDNSGDMIAPGSITVTGSISLESVLEFQSDLAYIRNSNGGAMTIESFNNQSTKKSRIQMFVDPEDHDNNRIDLTVDNTSSESSNWRFSANGTLTFPDATVQTTAFTGSIDYADVTNTPSIPPNDVDVGGTRYRLIAGDSIELVSSSANYFVRVSEGGPGNWPGTLIAGPITLQDAANTGINGSITFPDNTTQTTAWSGTVSYDDLTDKPTLATVATTGSYNDLSDLPAVPPAIENVSELTNDAGYITNTVTGDLTVSGTVTADNFEGSITITGDVIGTSANVELVAGDHIAVFDNTGVATFPGDLKGDILVSTNSAGDEGGEISLATPVTNTTLSGSVTVDVYRDKLRIFQGDSSKGVSLDLAKAPAGVGGELTWKASGLVNAGTFVTMDLLKATVTTSGNRGLSLASTTGSFNILIGGNYALVNSSVGGDAGPITITTTPSSSIFSWNFTASGDISTYIITDTTNSRAYRITLQIGDSYNNNFICIERLY